MDLGRDHISYPVRILYQAPSDGRLISFLDRSPSPAANSSSYDDGGLHRLPARTSFV